MNVKDCMSWEDFSKALAKEKEEREQAQAEIWEKIGTQMKQEEDAEIEKEVRAAQEKATREAIAAIKKAHGKNGNPASDAAWEKLAKELWS